MNSASDVKMQNMLDSITVMLQQGKGIEADFGQLIEGNDEVEGFATLIGSLHESLVTVEPSAEFAEQLGTQLLDSRRGFVTRVRQMPARVHVAAMLAIVAGFGLLIFRRVFGSATGQEIGDEPVATPS